MMTPTNNIQIPDRLYFRIGDVADILGVKPHVLRYWESEFPILAPQKSQTGQRVYRRSDVETLVMIRRLLHEERYSIEGARRRIRELRKDGALKSFKQDAVAEAKTQAPASATDDFIKEEAIPTGLVTEKAKALAEMAQLPLSSLFHF